MKNRYILFLYHTDYPQDDLAKWIAWYETTLPFKVVIDTKRLDLPLKFKYFLTNPNDPVTHGTRDLYGLDGIKEQLRPHVPAGEYHEVIYYYNKPPNAPDVANWTYPNDLNGAAFSEIVSTNLWNDDDFFYHANRHETFHRLHRCLWSKGIATQDTMDAYDFPANEMRNLALIVPHLEKLAEPPLAKLLVYLKALLKSLLDAAATLKPSRIKDWSKAISQWEVYAAPGTDPRYPKGTLAWFNKNPGNLKFARQNFAIGKDKHGHAIFDTHEHGWQALENQLRYVASGKSAVYNDYARKLGLADARELTIVQFQSKYAEANGVGYGNFVAKKLGVSPSTPIRQLL